MCTYVYVYVHMYISKAPAWHSNLCCPHINPARSHEWKHFDWHLKKHHAKSQLPIRRYARDLVRTMRKSREKSRKSGFCYKITKIHCQSTARTNQKTLLVDMQTSRACSSQKNSKKHEKLWKIQNFDHTEPHLQTHFSEDSPDFTA